MEFPRKKENKEASETEGIEVSEIKQEECLRGADERARAALG